MTICKQQQKNQYANIIPATYLYLMKMFHSSRSALAVVLFYAVSVFLISRFTVSSVSYTILVLKNRNEKTTLCQLPNKSCVHAIDAFLAFFFSS